MKLSTILAALAAALTFTQCGGAIEAPPLELEAGADAGAARACGCICIACAYPTPEPCDAALTAPDPRCEQ